MKLKIIMIIVMMSAAIFFFVNSPFAENSGDTKMDNESLKIATFAGGCFWCTESDFEKVKGVKEVISGYTGGHRPSARRAPRSVGSPAAWMAFWAPGTS